MTTKHLMALAIASAFALHANADTPALAFELADGTTEVLELENLEMSFSETSFLAANNQRNIEIPLANLKRFYFSGYVGVEKVDMISENTEVNVVSLTGINLGTYPSAEAALKNLPQGIYVIRKGSETSKMIVR